MSFLISAGRPSNDGGMLVCSEVSVLVREVASSITLSLRLLANLSLTLRSLPRMVLDVDYLSRRMFEDLAW